MCPLNIPDPITGRFDPVAVWILVRSIGDIALVVDSGGVVVDLALGSEGLAAELDADWVGKPWADTVTAETRPQLESLLHPLGEQPRADWRQVVHRGRTGRSIPIQYRVVDVDPDGRILAVGRELQAVASLQEQLVDAQQALERDYWRYRQMETRYRLLFQSVSEPVLIVDAVLRRVVEANPAAVSELGDTPARIVGRTFPEGFDAEGTQSIETLLGSVLATGRADSVKARRSGSEEDLLVSASLLRQDDRELFVVRLGALAGESGHDAFPADDARLIRAVGSAPEGIVLTDAEGDILSGNRAFLDQVEVPTEHEVRGQSMDRWLGRAGIDLNVLLGTLRQHGSLRLFKTTMRGQYGTVLEAEISAAAVADAEKPFCALFIRDVGRRLGREPPADGGLPAWVAEFTDRVGSAPLRDLVRESTDVIERLCIQAALKLTGGNRASAAELLGLSRQSLYVKLARHGVGSEAPGDD